MEEKFKKGFFEYIAAADAEKVHSQTIGWMFSNNCDVFDQNEKKEILNELLQLNKKKEEFSKIDSQVEIFDIDILLTCENHIIAIENKIKSTEHSNQLYKYEFVTAPNVLLAQESYKKWKNEDAPAEITIKPLFNNDKKRFYIYLTLIDETPTSANWINITYSQLHEVLKKFTRNKQTKRDIHIVNHYIQTIQNITYALELAINDTDIREWVFANAGLSKEDLITFDFTGLNPAIEYIAKSGLIKFIQRHYYSKVCNLLGGKNKELNYNGIKIRCKAESADNAGTGLIQIDFVETAFTHNALKFISGFQIQKNTKKINLVAVHYKNSKYTDLPENIEDVFKTKLQKFTASPFDFERWRFKNKLAYVSLTKNYNQAYTLAGMSPEELAEYIRKQLEAIFEATRQISAEYNNSTSVLEN